MSSTVGCTPAIICWPATWRWTSSPATSIPAGRPDVILLGGGLFLLWKSVNEIHGSLEGEGDGEPGIATAAHTFGTIIVQIAIIDIVFSLDSVITAVGLVDEVEIMIIAILIAVGVMIF